MARDLNPLRLRDRLRETLARYISTAVPVSDTRAPKLARAVRNALKAESTLLTKGPFLENLPDFKKRGSIRELIDSGVMADKWRVMQETGFERILHRPLHKHQELAIRQAAKNLNFIVATGTGSGKTECFLLPLVDQLLREGNLGAPGVRAVIIYPLNALANDQLYFRLAPLLLRQLNDPGITFGRFTGQVRANANRRQEESRLLDNDALRDALGLEPTITRLSKSWLLSRSEMLLTPPHILITNYAMLEHLLLLPRNAPLFHNARLRFLVLDEIHTYTGAQAIEVAFLLRKLKVQLGLESGNLQVIGTSASLNVENRKELAEFASDLFGEKFDSKAGLISGGRQLHPDLKKGTAQISLGADQWKEVGEVVNVMQEEENPTVEDWNIYCEDLDDSLQLNQPELKKTLTRRLATISEVRIVAQELAQGLRSFEFLAKTVFPESDPDTRNSALRSIIRSAVFARPNNYEFPILPARYHLALTGIEGGVIRLDAEAEEGWSDFRPKKSHNDPDGVPYFSLLSCRNCGEPYLEGWYHNGKMSGKPVPGSERAVFRIGALAKGAAMELDPEEEVTNEAEEIVYIDPKTGITGSAEVSGRVRVIKCELKEDKEEKRRYLSACVVCGNRASKFPEPITPLHPGNDALAAVATQVLFEALPGQDHASGPRPLAGRKLLAFSDNRQDAAFFAPFFERTSMDLALRACIAQALRKDAEPTGTPLRQARNRVWKLLGLHGRAAYKAHHGMEDSGDGDAKETLYAQIVAEFFTPSLVRVSLEGLGIASVQYDLGSLERIVEAIEKTGAGLKGKDAKAFVELTLDRIRSERAIANPQQELDLADDTIWGPFKNQSGRCFVLERNPRQSGSTLGLLPAGSTANRSTWILETRLNLTRDLAFKVLQVFWHQAMRERLLLRVGVGYGLNLDKLRIADGGNLPIYECNTCGTRTFRSVRSVCPAWKCKGKLEDLSKEARETLEKENHYAHLYLRETDRVKGGSNAVAKEHSAVIGGQLRETIEENFRIGKVNLLSCTTTLELGVDLGDLEAIVCKNVPPGVVNYQQRTGRAGRRAQAAPVALTIARNSNYDQASFHRFDRYLADPAPVPFLALDNADFFRRHQVSIILARFLRTHIEKTGTGAPQLKDLFSESLTKDEVSVFLDTFLNWLESKEGVDAKNQAQRLVSTLPEEFRPIGLQDDELAKHTRDVLSRFVHDIASRWQLLQKRRIEARDADRDIIAAIMQRQQTNLLNQFLVDALSRSAVIPTYSFPVHTCRLEIIRGKGQRPTPFGNLEGELQLDRSATLAISEYAPEAEVVAGGRIWISRGIVRYPKEFMPIMRYRVCNSCGHVDIKDDLQDFDGRCSQCSSKFAGHFLQGKFIEPKGFLTSVKDRKGRDPGSTRIRQRPGDEARLVTQAPVHRYEDTDMVGARTFYAPAFPGDDNEDLRGRLFIVNRGPHGGGYLRCGKCEYAEPATQAAKYGKPVKTSHDNPRTGEKCPVTELNFPFDLGHVFETDLRAFAFTNPIPRFEDDPEDKSGEDSFLRTLAEALRLAAVRLLQIDSRDLAATFQRDGYRPVVILYDSTPGGAGYSRRLGSGGQLSTMNLVKKALAILKCHADCASSCVRCLNDYGNQAHWEEFDRHRVFPWLEALAAGAQIKEGVAPDGAVRWEVPSKAGLLERLRGSRNIEIFVPRIAGGEDCGRQLETAKFIRNLLEASPDRIVRIYTEHPVRDSVAEGSGQELKALALLAEMEKTGRLKFLVSGLIERRSGFPRLAVDTAANGNCYFSQEWDRPLLNGLLSNGTVFVEGMISNTTKDRIERVKQDCRSESNALGQFLRDTKRFDFPVGKAVDLAQVFAPLINVEKAAITIRDPYLLSREHNLESAAELLDYLFSLCGCENKVTLIWDPSRYGGNPSDMIREFKKKLKGRNLSSVPIRYKQRRKGEGGHFHDRRVIADINQSGDRKQFRWDLTSGVDNLMDKFKEASVFLTQIV